MINKRSLVLSSLALSAVGLGTFATAQGTASAPSDPIRTFAVPGTDTVVRTVRDASGHHASFSRDRGQTWQRLPDVQTDLNLRYARFDPLVQGEPTIPNGLGAPASNRLFIVQFATEAIDEFRHDLAVLGAERRAALPHQAYLVRMDRATATQVAAKPYVRWVGDFHVAYKLDAAILGTVLAGADSSERMYNVVMVDPLRDRQQTLARIEAVGGTAQPDSGMGILQVATLTTAQVVALAADDSVEWIDPLTEATPDIDQARIQGGANDVEAMGGFNGKGITGMIMEGIEQTHTEFAAIAPYRVAPVSIPVGNATAAASTGHGTNTAGEIYARGASALYKGLIPFAQMFYCNYNYVINTNNRKSVTAAGVAGINGRRQMIETASWGYAQNTVYDSRSQEMDDIIFDLDVLITQSQSNTGNNNSRPQAWAKNIVACGAVQHLDTANPADDVQSGTSTGPAADGRIKPDMCAYYDSIRTTNTGNGYTTGFGGTSGATPIVNGHAGLLAQMFAEGNFGHPPAPSFDKLFDHKAHFTTIKALLANTAYQYPHAQIGGRYRQGWGFPDVKNAYNLREKMIVVDEAHVLLQGQSRDYLVFVPSGTPELKVTMVHNDPPGTSAANIHRINSLDLEVRSPSGTQYWGNNGLVSNLYNTAGGVANDRDTVENVFVQNPTRGVWAVGVKAQAVRQDSHKETGAVDADFALVVSGIGGSRNKTGPVLDLTSTGPGNFGVSISSLPAGFARGFTVFSATTTGILGNGNWLGVELDGLVIASVSVPAAPFSFTNTPGTYPNVGYTFPVGLATALSGITFDAMAFFLDASGAIIAVSNTDRQKVQ
jgi:hypothetical protein